ncbi:MAG: amidohydrolase [Calditrichaeota bacterium]|nr:MAG: amidohydrolase [Calditrichota bacterium]MBL1206539.1 amidohydrolase [Calditrichota bacterium]NOG46366.1 amidohydrolase family protein [Calditrichota bacterium]
MIKSKEKKTGLRMINKNLSLKIIAFCLLLIILAGCTGMLTKIAGDFKGPPEEMHVQISAKAKELISDAFSGIDKNKLFDYHNHIVGLNTHNSGTFVNPAMQSVLHPFRNIRYKVYLNAAGINDPQLTDSLYVDRLVRLVRAIPDHGKYAIMAFDKHYNKDGIIDTSLTDIYTPNNYVYQVSQNNLDLFIPAISVHPYRKDAIEELEKWAAKGIKIVKWLPNAMGMNPADSTIIPFYKTMIKHNMVLLSHAGEEKAVEAEEMQKLGNPLLYRLPLDLGLKVIIAHCASLGENEDLDSEEKEPVSNFELFLRLMNNPKYENHLYGEISGITQYNRFKEALKVLLEKEEWHHRLVNGSDYPLPAINFVIRTSSLEKAGFITEEEEEALNEIYSYNPLLFDFVLKRTVRHPESGKKFSDDVFHSPFNF